MLARMLALVAAWSAATALAIAAPAAGTMALPPQPAVRPAGMPAGYVLVSPCVPQMGEHWANPRDLKLPIYGTYRGRVIFSEIMIPKTVLDRGFDYSDLKALPGHTIDHVDIGYEPHGHAGMPIPHYDIHAYYISAAQVARICPARSAAR